MIIVWLQMCREQLHRPQTWGKFHSSDSIAKMEKVAEGLQESYQALHTLHNCSKADVEI